MCGVLAINYTLSHARPSFPRHSCVIEHGSDVYVERIPSDSVDDSWSIILLTLGDGPWKRTESTPFVILLDRCRCCRRG